MAAFTLVVMIGHCSFPRYPPIIESVTDIIGSKSKILDFLSLFDEQYVLTHAIFNFSHNMVFEKCNVQVLLHKFICHYSWKCLGMLLYGTCRTWFELWGGMGCIRLSCSEVMQFFQNLKVNKGRGPDNIPPKLLLS